MIKSGELQGTDDLPISWDLHLPTTQPPVACVLLIHGFKGFKDWGFFPTVARRLASAGFAVVRFNTSHNGTGLADDSSDFTRLDLFRKNRSSYEVADALRVIDAVTKGEISDLPALDLKRVFLMGHSRGGGAMIAAGAQRQVGAIATWASVASFALPLEWQAGFDQDGYIEILNGRTGQMMPVDRTAWDDVTPMPASLDLSLCVSQQRAPQMFLHGSADPSVSPKAATALHEASEGRAELVLIEGADHVMNARHPFEGATPQLDSAIEKTIAFFQSC